MITPQNYTVREWGKLSFNDSKKNENLTVINKTAWDELANIAETSDKNNRYLGFVNSHTLRFKNFVGVITTSDGTQIEILPKISTDKQSQKELEEGRELLWKMIAKVHKVPWIETTEALLKVKKQPLHETLIRLFLTSLNKVVKRGLRSDYHRISSHEKFLKGQLQLSKQLNEPPHRQHLFHIEYDIFSANRAENRLIHSALFQVSCWIKKLENNRLCRELSCYFSYVPFSKSIVNDLKLWHHSAKDRSMSYYQPLLPLLELILNQQNPFTIKNKHRGISFLLPMERLFEDYVGIIIKQNLQSTYVLSTQDSSQYSLAYDSEKGKKFFALKPDFVIREKTKAIAVLDTKWKLINKKDLTPEYRKDNGYSIKQSDMYQLFAYGKKYDVTQTYLIYPQHALFNEQKKWAFDDNLAITILPFDLQRDTGRDLVSRFF